MYLYVSDNYTEQFRRSWGQTYIFKVGSFCHWGGASPYFTWHLEASPPQCEIRRDGPRCGGHRVKFRDYDQMNRRYQGHRNWKATSRHKKLGDQYSPAAVITKCTRKLEEVTQLTDQKTMNQATEALCGVQAWSSNGSHTAAARITTQCKYFNVTAIHQCNSDLQFFFFALLLFYGFIHKIENNISISWSFNTYGQRAFKFHVQMENKIWFNIILMFSLADLFSNYKRPV